MGLCLPGAPRVKGTGWSLPPSGYVCFSSILPLLLLPPPFKLIFSTDGILQGCEIYVFPERCRPSFSFRCGGSKIMGNMLAILKQMCVRSPGDSDAMHAVFPPNIWEPASLFFQSVSEAKETIGRVHKSLHMSVRSHRTQTLCWNGTWHG